VFVASPVEIAAEVVVHTAAQALSPVEVLLHFSRARFA
jgi:hypothetical protein